jgi:hypothetical protein
MKKLFFFVFLCSITSSCNFFYKKQVEKIYQEWTGKEIIMPDSIKFKSLSQDTLCSYLFQKQYKILIYADSIGCQVCQIGLQDWKGMIQICKQKQFDVGFIFVVHASNFKKFEAEVVQYLFEPPIIYDYNNDFDKLNHFPPYPYRTFFFFFDNKVLLIGSPINNHEMWEKYLSIMAKQ